MGWHRASHVAQNANNLLNAVTVIGMFGALLLGASALVLALVMLLLITALWSAIYIFLGRRTLRNLMLTAPPAAVKPPGSDRRLFGELIWQGLGYQAGALWQAILFQGSIVVAGSVLGTTGAALGAPCASSSAVATNFSSSSGKPWRRSSRRPMPEGLCQAGRDYRNALAAAVISAACIVLALLIVGPALSTGGRVTPLRSITPLGRFSV